MNDERYWESPGGLSADYSEEPKPGPLLSKPGGRSKGAIFPHSKADVDGLYEIMQMRFSIQDRGRASPDQSVKPTGALARKV